MVRRGGIRYLYYIGWSLGVTVPFYVFVGCAISEDGGRTYARVSPAPILERTSTDPYFVASPWVIVESGVWRMWYTTATGWDIEQGQPRHHYRISYAESDDGIVWRREGRVCIDFLPGEYAISAPCAVKERDGYRMWYSRRGESYRIGYAVSSDGLTWERRDDDVGIDVAPSGWDSEMIEYPCVFDVGGRRNMIYNGNGYGRTGVGLAVWDEG